MEEAGIITENERKIIEGLDEKCIQVNVILSFLCLNVFSFSIPSTGCLWCGLEQW